MASGLPVVATGVGCLPDLVVEGQTGFLVPPRDSDRLGARVLELLGNPVLREKMGRAGRERVEEKFDERAVVERLEWLYREIVERKP
jgi:glycosyltransferase involved in cell wall biosynthesis